MMAAVELNQFGFVLPAFGFEKTFFFPNFSYGFLTDREMKLILNPLSAKRRESPLQSDDLFPLLRRDECPGILGSLRSILKTMK
jgi:hypothetical protein